MTIANCVDSSSIVQAARRARPDFLHSDKLQRGPQVDATRAGSSTEYVDRDAGHAEVPHTMWTLQCNLCANGVPFNVIVKEA